MFKIKTLNNISSNGLDLFTKGAYEVGDEVENPDAYILRSFKMHDMDIPDHVKAVGRAGAGVNSHFKLKA